MRSSSRRQSAARSSITHSMRAESASLREAGGRERERQAIGRCVLAAMLPLGIVLAAIRPPFVYWRGLSASAEADSGILRRCGLSDLQAEILAVRIRWTR
jgi:hypothetical protein